jgi:hypothetical protein
MRSITLLSLALLAACSTSPGYVAPDNTPAASLPVAPADAAEAAVVSTWLTDKTSGLDSWAYDNIKKSFTTKEQFDSLVNAIVNSCAAFAPKVANWQRYCEAVITSAIVSESSYVPTSVSDTGMDPTVGLLQDRFSSTVQDYNAYGRFDTIAGIGCAWPDGFKAQIGNYAFWNGSGATYIGFLSGTACNIGLATWYYFINATGNGGSSAVYADAYCKGKGIAATMVVGLLSHLMGPAGPHPPDPNNGYVTGIKTRFVKLLGGLPTPDPFGESLPPSPTQFCR